MVFWLLTTSKQQFQFYLCELKPELHNDHRLVSTMYFLAPSSVQ